MQKLCNMKKNHVKWMYLTHNEFKRKRNQRQRVKKSASLSPRVENDSHPWLPSKGGPHDGQGLVPAHNHSAIHTHTHTNPVMDTHTHSNLHTPTHLMSVLRDACWVHTHNQARISTTKLSAGNEVTQNHTPLSPPAHILR